MGCGFWFDLYKPYTKKACYFSTSQLDIFVVNNKEQFIEILHYALQYHEQRITDYNQGDEFSKEHPSAKDKIGRHCHHHFIFGSQGRNIETQGMMTALTKQETKAERSMFLKI